MSTDQAACTDEALVCSCNEAQPQRPSISYGGRLLVYLKPRRSFLVISKGEFTLSPAFVLVYASYSPSLHAAALSPSTLQSLAHDGRRLTHSCWAEVE